ncbi:hypothetical protein [Fibrella forsythiae]|uniref:Lipoprotein n=1 Tax=Fibrella forsythiae TaxID=2817061 RepID=A0ABS3JLH6_9BACT|nr:hypothetical protein [Fibrella forsythiae]MBO0950860.1 hypothetical protein [Fibrella forsythiae]
MKKTLILFLLLSFSSCQKNDVPIQPETVVEVEDDNDQNNDRDENDSSDSNGRIAADRESSVWQVSYPSGYFEKNALYSWYLYNTRSDAQANLNAIKTKPVRKATSVGNGIALFKTRTLYYGFYAVTVSVKSGSQAGTQIAKFVRKHENNGPKSLTWIYNGTPEDYLSFAKVKVKPAEGQLSGWQTVWVPVNTQVEFKDWIKDYPDPKTADRAHTVALAYNETMCLPWGKCILAFVNGTDVRGVYLNLETAKTYTIKPKL